MEQTEQDPIEAAGARREAAWKALDAEHRKAPGCEHMAASDGSLPDCEHVRAWRGRLDAAMEDYRAALAECDRVAAEFFLTTPAAGTPIG